MTTLLTNVVYPALLWTGLALHAFTTITAYQLAGPGALKYLASIAAWAMPGIAEGVVAYYAWQASGSRVNAYSVWVLAWFGIVLAVALLASVSKRRRQPEAPPSADFPLTFVDSRYLHPRDE